LIYFKPAFVHRDFLLACTENAQNPPFACRLTFVLDLPECGPRHAKAPAEFDAENALVGLGQLINGARPNLHRRFGCRVAARMGPAIGEICRRHKVQ
jgi:hypothetical protein